MIVKMIVDLPSHRGILLSGICDSQHALYLLQPDIIPGWRVNKHTRWRVSDYLSLESNVNNMTPYNGNYESILSFIRPSLISVTPGSNTIVIDCTSSDVVTSLYRDLLSSGIHIVTANKKGMTPK